MNWIKLKKAFKRALPEWGATLMRPIKVIWWWITMVVLAVIIAGVILGMLAAIFIHTKSTLLVVAALLIAAVIGKLAILTHKHYTKLRY